MGPLYVFITLLIPVFGCDKCETSSLLQHDKPSLSFRSLAATSRTSRSPRRSSNTPCSSYFPSWMRRSWTRTRTIIKNASMQCNHSSKHSGRFLRLWRARLWFTPVSLYLILWILGPRQPGNCGSCPCPFWLLKTLGTRNCIIGQMWIANIHWSRRFLDHFWSNTANTSKSKNSMRLRRSRR